MTFFWLLVGIFCVTAIPMAMSIQQMRKHDQILFKICQLRRECFQFMREQDAHLTRNDYISMRLLIKILNFTIKRYGDYKTVLFDYRMYYKYFKDNERSFHRTAKVLHTDNEEVMALFKKFRICLFDAFFTFTPLLKSEIICRFVLFSMETAAKAGWKAAYTRFRYGLYLLQNEAQYAQRNFSPMSIHTMESLRATIKIPATR